MVVIVGDDAASHVYVRNKQRACERIGIKKHSLRPPDQQPLDLIDLVDNLNKDVGVDGILGPKSTSCRIRRDLNN